MDKLSELKTGDKIYLLDRLNIKEGFIETTVIDNIYKGENKMNPFKKENYCELIFDIPNICNKKTILVYINDKELDNKVRLFNEPKEGKQYYRFILSFDKKIIINYLENWEENSIKFYENEIIEYKSKITSYNYDIETCKKQLKDLKKLKNE